MLISAVTRRLITSRLGAVVATGVVLVFATRASAQSACSSEPLAVQVLGSGGPTAGAASVRFLFLALSSLILRIRSLLRVPKFPVRCRREFTLDVPSRRAQLACRVSGQRANSMKFPVFFPVSRELAAETSSRVTASSAS